MARACPEFVACAHCGVSVVEDDDALARLRDTGEATCDVCFYAQWGYGGE